MILETSCYKSQFTDFSMAIAGQQFLLLAQPIVRTCGPSDEEIRLEILIGRRNSKCEVLSASLFLPKAQEVGLTKQIDRSVIDASISYLIQREELNMPRMKLCSINLAATTLNDPTFEYFAAQQLSRLEYPEQICFEVTETEAIENVPAVASSMHRLKAHGCRFSLDDFGAGACSFVYLRNLPVDFLKIDGQFVQRCWEDAGDRAIVESIHTLANKLGIETVAECVEDIKTYRTVLEIGVDYCQGFYFGRPHLLGSDVSFLR